MKSDQLNQLHQSSLIELVEKKTKLGQELVTVKQAIKTGKEKNVKKAAHIRRQLAVINTIIRQKQLVQPSIE